MRQRHTPGLAQVATDMVVERARARLTTTTSPSVVPSPAPTPFTLPLEAPEKPVRGRGQPKAKLWKPAWHERRQPCSKLICTPNEVFGVQNDGAKSLSA